MRSQTWTPLPPPSPQHLSGSSSCTSPKHAAPYVRHGLAIQFLHDSIQVKKCLSIYKLEHSKCGIVYLHKPGLSGKVLIALAEFRSKTRMSVASTSVQCTGGIQFNEVIKNNKIYKGWKEKQHYHYWQVILLHIEEYINSKNVQITRTIEWI